MSEEMQLAPTQGADARPVACPVCGCKRSVAWPGSSVENNDGSTKCADCGIRSAADTWLPTRDAAPSDALSDEQILAIAEEHTEKVYGDDSFREDVDVIAFARAIIAASAPRAI